MAALGIDKSNLSRLISIATRLPGEIVEAIGPAPAIGRNRWQELSELLGAAAQRERAALILAQPEMRRLGSDARFEAVAAHLRKKASRQRPEFWNATDGTRAARVLQNKAKLTLTFDDRVTPNFGEFVRSRLKALYDEYKAGVPSA